MEVKGTEPTNKFYISQPKMEQQPPLTRGEGNLSSSETVVATEHAQNLGESHDTRAVSIWDQNVEWIHMAQDAVQGLGSSLL
jgi:hypothetical protein